MMQSLPSVNLLKSHLVHSQSEPKSSARETTLTWPSSEDVEREHFHMENKCKCGLHLQLSDDMSALDKKVASPASEI